MKVDVIGFYKEATIKFAASNLIGRSIKTIQDRDSADVQFRHDILSSKARFAKSSTHKIRLDNLYANLYPEDFKTPTQTVDIDVTTIEGPSSEELITEGNRLGLDITPHEAFLSPSADPGAAPQDPTQEGA